MTTVETFTFSTPESEQERFVVRRAPEIALGKLVPGYYDRDQALGFHKTPVFVASRESTITGTTNYAVLFGKLIGSNNMRSMFGSITGIRNGNIAHDLEQLSDFPVQEGGQITFDPKLALLQAHLQTLTHIATQKTDLPAELDKIAAGCFTFTQSFQHLLFAQNIPKELRRMEREQQGGRDMVLFRNGIVRLMRENGVFWEGRQGPENASVERVLNRFNQLGPQVKQGLIKQYFDRFEYSEAMRKVSEIMSDLYHPAATILRTPKNEIGVVLSQADKSDKQSQGKNVVTVRHRQGFTNVTMEDMDDGDPIFRIKAQGIREPECLLPLAYFTENKYGMLHWNLTTHTGIGQLEYSDATSNPRAFASYVLGEKGVNTLMGLTVVDYISEARRRRNDHYMVPPKLARPGFAPIASMQRSEELLQTDFIKNVIEYVQQYGERE